MLGAEETRQTRMDKTEQVAQVCFMVAKVLHALFAKAAWMTQMFVGQEGTAVHKWKGGKGC